MENMGSLAREALDKRTDYLTTHPEERRNLENMSKYDAAQLMKEIEEGQARTAALYAEKCFKG